MADLTLAEKRRQIVEYLRDPLRNGHPNAAIARFFDVSPGMVANVREQVEAQGSAFLRGTLHELPVAAIRTDGGTQSRAGLTESVVREYRDEIQRGAVFPPIGVVYDGTDYWLWDGFHRVGAARQADREVITAEVRQGTRRDAVLLAAGANADHGLRRTNDDKRRAVEHLLRDPEWSGKTDHWIARVCRVSPHTIKKFRAEIEPGNLQMPNAREAADGRLFPARMNARGNGQHLDDGPTEDDPPLDVDQAESPHPTPPMSPPVVHRGRVSVILYGDPAADAARLRAEYPPSELPRLAALLAGHEDMAAGPAPAPRRLNQQHESILMCLRQRPDGLTREEIEQATSIPANAVRPRIVELKGWGLVVDTGHTRPTSTGSPARVLAASPEIMEAAS